MRGSAAAPSTCFPTQRRRLDVGITPPGLSSDRALKSCTARADPKDMRSFLRRLASPSCSSCRGRRSSAYAVACAGCGSDIGPKRGITRDSALVWLLGGAIVGCLTMLALAPQP